MLPPIKDNSTVCVFPLRSVFWTKGNKRFTPTLETIMQETRKGHSGAGLEGTDVQPITDLIKRQPSRVARSR